MHKPKSVHVKVPRVAIYARVSTTDQNCALQLKELRDYCKRRDWELAGEYVDTGISGTKARRPQLDRLMADAKLRRVDCIVVWKLDRWGRNLMHCLESVHELIELGVRWIAVTQNLDTDASNPMSRLLLHLMAIFAEFEHELIVERTKAGLAEARRQGRCGGRPARVFSRDRARALRAEGKSWRAIGRELKVPQSTIRKALKASA